jgi:DNA replication initiation complex subunit (GINS family)
MQEERRPLDPTRRLLRVFGVKVTDYEERTAAILEQAAAAGPGQAAELLRLTAEAIELTADLNARLRDMNEHVLDTQARVLSGLKAAIQKASA